MDTVPYALRPTPVPTRPGPVPVPPPAPTVPDDFVASSPAMLEVLRLAWLYAPSEEPVVLVGATGTGKSSLARRIHEWSGRGGTLAERSCGELGSSLAADDLFGHEKWAFTGAATRRLGLLAEAGAGTVLLDDFHMLGRARQAMLLRVLDVKQYRRLGADRSAHLLARVIVGSGVELAELERRGTLLPDLRYRLEVLVIRVPPLVERREDIAQLAQRFLAECAAAPQATGVKRFAPEVVASLELAPWPGNVRELERAVLKAYIHAEREEEVRYEHLPAAVRVAPRFRRGASRADKVRLIEWALWRTGGNVSAAADLIGAHRNTVGAVKKELDRARESERSGGRRGGRRQRR